MTAAPDWVCVAFQICEMVCEPGHEKVTFQPFVAAVPEFATVKPSWKPPLHELASDQITVQPKHGRIAGNEMEVGRAFFNRAAQPGTKLLRNSGRLFICHAHRLPYVATLPVFFGRSKGRNVTCALLDPLPWGGRIQRDAQTDAGEDHG